MCRRDAGSARALHWALVSDAARSARHGTRARDRRSRSASTTRSLRKTPTSYGFDGGRDRSANFADRQLLTERCGRFGLIETKRVFSIVPAPYQHHYHGSPATQSRRRCRARWMPTIKRCLVTDIARGGPRRSRPYERRQRVVHRFAVLRLISNSNLVDCWTGRSAGFSPLRMRAA